MGLFDVLGFNGDAQAAHKAGAFFDQGRKMLLNQMTQQNQDYLTSESLLKSLQSQIASGYGAARGDLARAGSTAKSDILGQQKQQLGGAAQSLTSRGLYNTTALEGAQRGIHADTSRALASVDESVGNLLSGLRQNQTSAQLGATSALASFYPQRSADQLASKNNYIDFLFGKQVIKPNFGSYLAGTLGSAAQMAAYAAGGGFGGGGGGVPFSPMDFLKANGSKA